MPNIVFIKPEVAVNIMLRVDNGVTVMEAGLMPGLVSREPVGDVFLARPVM